MRLIPIIILIILLISFVSCGNLITGKAVYLPKNIEFFKSEYSNDEIWFTIANNSTFTDCIVTLDTIDKANLKIINSSTVKINDIIQGQKIKGIFHYEESAGTDQKISYVCS